MARVRVLFFMVFIAGNAAAQTNSDAAKLRYMDSVKAAFMDEAALKYPLIRQFSFSHEETGAGNTRSELLGKDLFKGRLRTARTAINLNVPVIDRGKNTLVAGLGAVQQQFYLDGVTGYDPQYPVYNTNNNMTTFSATLAFNHRDSLFGLPVVFNAGVTGLFNQSFSRQKLTYSALVSFSFIRNKNSSLVAGLVGIKDPASPVPVFLFLSYAHRFRQAGIDVMVNVPSGITVRKELTRKASLSAFGELSGSNIFIDINNPTLPKEDIYSSLQVKSGLRFEYRLTKKVVLGCSAGLQSTLTSRITEQGQQTNDYFINTHTKMVPYVQAGISLLPFWKGFR